MRELVESELKQPLDRTLNFSGRDVRPVDGDLSCGRDAGATQWQLSDSKHARLRKR